VDQRRHLVVGIEIGELARLARHVDFHDLALHVLLVQDDAGAMAVGIGGAGVERHDGLAHPRDTGPFDDAFGAHVAVLWWRCGARAPAGMIRTQWMSFQYSFLRSQAKNRNTARNIS